jgi:hypothetical protein
LELAPTKLFAAPATATPQPASNPSVIATTSTNAKDVAVLAGGIRVAAWSDGANVYAQRFDSAGTLVGDKLQVGAGANFSGLAALASGGYVVQYQRADAVLAQKVTASGALAGAPLVVRTQAQITADFPPNPYYPEENATLAGGGTVVALPDGGFAAEYIKYQSSHIPGTIAYDVFAQKFDAAGNAVGSPVLLRSEGSVTSFTTAPVPSSGLLVADILACPCSGAGAPGTTIFDTNLQRAHIAFGCMPGNNASPSAAAMSDGNFVMAWTAAGAVQGQVFAADSTTVTGSRNVTPVINFQNAAPGARVIALAGGGFLIAGSGTAQAFGANGQAVSPVMQVLDGNVAATPDGGFVDVAQVGSQLVVQQYSFAH